MARRLNPRQHVAGRLIALAIEMPPVLYVVATGRVPGWVRIWLAVWLALWLLATVATSARAEVSRAGQSS